jgi:hypothetical protein
MEPWLNEVLAGALVGGFAGGSVELYVQEMHGENPAHYLNRGHCHRGGFHRRLSGCDATAREGTRGTFRSL